MSWLLLCDCCPSCPCLVGSHTRASSPRIPCAIGDVLSKAYGLGQMQAVLLRCSGEAVQLPVHACQQTQPWAVRYQAEPLTLPSDDERCRSCSPQGGGP